MSAGFEYVGARLRTAEPAEAERPGREEAENPKDAQIGQLLTRISELELSVAWQQRQIHKWWTTAEQLRVQLPRVEEAAPAEPVESEDGSPVEQVEPEDG